jgi:hypothetical protein
MRELSLPLLVTIALIMATQLPAGWAAILLWASCRRIWAVGA